MLNLENSTPSHNRNLLAFAKAAIDRLESGFSLHFCHLSLDEERHIYAKLAELKSHKQTLEAEIAAEEK